MNRCYAFPGRRFIWCPPRHLAVAALLTQLFRRYTPTVRRFICMLLRDRRIDRCFPLTKASVHPVLKTSSWCVSVLIQTERRIDQRCPHLDCRNILCYYLCCSSSATHPTLLENGPSVHPTVPRVSPNVPTRPMIAPMLVI
jgi:hypothetical protein